MNWKELLEEETELYQERLLRLREMGKAFTYQQIADAWGTAMPNTNTKMAELIEKGNGLIERKTSTTPYTIIFHWDKEVEKIIEKAENEKTFPSYIQERTHSNILSYLDERGIWGDGCELVFRRGDSWDPISQRGGLNIIIAVDGLPALEFKARFDNGLILKGSGCISTVSTNTIKEYISEEMKQDGRIAIASYFEDDE